MRIPLVFGSSAPLEIILCHKNVLMIIQSLGFNGYLSLIYSLIPHSITLAHPEQSSKQTTRRSMDDNEVHPKRPEKGVEDAAIRNNDMSLKIPPHLVVRSRRHGQGHRPKQPLKEGPISKQKKQSGTEMKAKYFEVYTKTNAEEGGITRKRYSSCRYNERQLIDVTVVRCVRPRAERSCDTTTH